MMEKLVGTQKVKNFCRHCDPEVIWISDMFVYLRQISYGNRVRVLRAKPDDVCPICGSIYGNTTFVQVENTPRPNGAR